jgi:hypothetical protein
MRTHLYRSCIRPLTPYEPSEPSERATARVTTARILRSSGDGQLALPLMIGPPSPPPVAPAQPSRNAQRDRQFAGRLMTKILEACQGRRPLAQIQRLLEPELYERLLTAEPPGRQPCVLRSVHTCRPVDDAVETCATVHSGPRAFAAAARFETSQSGWLCTRFELLKPRARQHRMSA